MSTTLHERCFGTRGLPAQACVLAIAALAACAPALAGLGLRAGPPQDGTRELWAVVTPPEGLPAERLLGVTSAREIRQAAAGGGGSGLLWLTWREDGAAYHAVSHDGGAT